MHYSTYEIVVPRPLRDLVQDIHETWDDLFDRVSSELTREQVFLIGIERQLLLLRVDVDDFPELTRTIKAMLHRL